MGQEAYSMFPALAQMSANARLANAQAGNVGQETAFAKQRYGDEQAALGAFGNAGKAGGFGGPSQVSVPGGQPFVTPQPGQPSMPGFQPFKPPSGIRVPEVGGPAMGGPSGQPAPLPQAAQPPAQPAQAEGAHPWTPGPGEQYDTPDGSRPRSLDEVFGALKKANPKAPPAVLARAAAMYLPWMTEADQVEVKKAISENTAAIHASDAEARGRLEKFKQTEITNRNDQDNATAVAVAKSRATAAQKRVDSVSARQERIAANVIAMKEKQLEEARRSGDGRAALAAQKELRLQQAEITRLKTFLSNAKYNASFLKGEAQAAALEEAADAYEEGMAALQALPDPTADPNAPARKPADARGSSRLLNPAPMTQ